MISKSRMKFIGAWPNSSLQARRLSKLCYFAALPCDWVESFASKLATPFKFYEPNHGTNLDLQNSFFTKRQRRWYQCDVGHSASFDHFINSVTHSIRILLSTEELNFYARIWSAAKNENDACNVTVNFNIYLNKENQHLRCSHYLQIVDPSNIWVSQKTIHLKTKKAPKLSHLKEHLLSFVQIFNKLFASLPRNHHFHHFRIMYR